MEKSQQTMKAPKILCEVLVHGIESDKPKIKRMLDKLQRLIDKSKTNNSKVRALWYIDSGEKTIEEKKQWLIENSNCIFYVFTPEDYKIADNYLSNIMLGVNMFDNSLKLMRNEGVVMKKHIKKQDEIDFEEIKPTIPTAPLEILD
jgi:hypothetical protein